MTRSQPIPHLRELREVADYSQTELAKRANMHRVTILRAEHGSAVTFTTVARIAHALGVTPEDLI